MSTCSEAHAGDKLICESSVIKYVKALFWTLIPAVQNIKKERDS